MKTQGLLRLYPRAWRDRYGDEFLELMGEEPLGLQQQVDIIMGAIDARLSWSPHNREERVMVGLRTVCTTKGSRMTTRDGLIGAGIYLGMTALLAILGTWLKRNGMEAESEIVLAMAFPAAMVFAMPVTFMKGQPLKSQAVVMGTTFGILLLITYIATFIN